VPTFAWVIDQTSCIGCHACTTACKQENEVPLGVNRTWVKYVETGTFPQTRRQIAVLRCNHCAEPPCVEVCPTSAMFRRPDGIVDFDTSRCIGCKACLQACPYDAIYIDPEEHVAEKCNFCAHRVDRGLLPSCVVVCPTESLMFGDLDDPASRVSQLVSSRPTTVRRPEQGTGPKAFYLGASDAALDPNVPVHEDSYMWSDRRHGGAKDHTAATAGWRTTTDEVDLLAMARSNDGSATRVARAPLPMLNPDALALMALKAPVAPGSAGATTIAATSGIGFGATGGGRGSSVPAALRMPKARVAYDVFHPRPWGWKVALYLWTKGIGAGAFGLVFLIAAFGLAAPDQFVRLGVAFISLAAVGATALLLVWDLKRPERFLSILYRPQWRSWLTIGAFVLIGYSGLLGLWFLGTWLGVDDGLLAALGWPTAVLAVLAALYTAFLLGQCEARDLWQSPAVIVVLLAQAMILGAASLLAVAVVSGAPASIVEVGRVALIAGAVVNVAALILGEAAVSHPTTNARAAAHLLVRGPYWTNFWLGGVVAAGVIPLLVALVAPVALATSGAGLFLVGAGLVAAAGLLWYELGFIAAGQAVPIS
jgi:Fe-S-cluster-containing dehydrogenase component/formate-dependent nitrite reductase membrane component NrfD